MACQLTEIYRNCRIWLFPVTEILPSPYKGEEGIGGSFRKFLGLPK